MHHGVAAVDGAAQSIDFEQVAGDCFEGEASQVFKLTGGADQDTETASPAREFLCDVAANEAGRPCEENFQTCAPVKTASAEPNAVAVEQQVPPLRAARSGRDDKSVVAPAL
jgi:hypothetical protein